jgi:hypothetical protein
MITDTESGIVNVGILGSRALSSLLALLGLIGPLAVALLFFKVVEFVRCVEFVRAEEFARFVELDRWLECERVGDPTGLDILVELAILVEFDRLV